MQVHASWPILVILVGFFFGCLFSSCRTAPTDIPMPIRERWRADDRRDAEWRGKRELAGEAQHRFDGHTRRLEALGEILGKLDCSPPHLEVSEDACREIIRIIRSDAPTPR